ncbi:unnamed protein product [Sphagnum troendelagicum]
MPNPYKVVAQATPNTLSQNLHDMLQGKQILLSEVSRQSILHPNFGGTSRDCSSACCAFDNDPPTTREKHRRIFGSFERPTNSQLRRNLQQRKRRTK